MKWPPLYSKLWKANLPRGPLLEKYGVYLDRVTVVIRLTNTEPFLGICTLELFSPAPNHTRSGPVLHSRNSRATSHRTRSGPGQIQARRPGDTTADHSNRARQGS